jgi:iron complex outermembrane recepter protein
VYLRLSGRSSLSSISSLIAFTASIAAFAGTSSAMAQSAAQPTELPPVEVEATAEKKKVKKKTDVTDTRLTGTGVSTSGGKASSGAAGGNGDGAAAPGSSGITGASTSIITREQIARSPQATVADIISREAGVQSSSFYGGVNGVGTTIDLRGFGPTGPSNTLVLINGRRLNDWDLPGFDLSSIAKDSIERIEITRGNSGAVLYGDGAVGGVVNIVTRNGADTPNQVRVEAGLGSFKTREESVTASASKDGFSGFINGNVIESDGYRTNNELQQRSVVGDFRWAFNRGSIYLNVAADDQDLRLPGPRGVLAAFDIDELHRDRRGTNSPYDYGNKQGARGTLGLTYFLDPGVELIVDGGIRSKWTQFASIPYSYNDTDLTTTSLTPRVNITQRFFGLPSRVLAGVDLFDTDYESHRSQSNGAAPNHIYDAGQTTLAGYWMQTVSAQPGTDISAGGRVQWSDTRARDTYDPTAPGSASPQGIPLDDSETNYAWHLGVEHKLMSGLALTARGARSFRVPNVDERVGASPLFTVTNFDLQTQTSYDWETGFRWNFGQFEIQSSFYQMYLENEIRLSPITFANINLDPTRRQGVETIASLQVTKDVRLRGNLTYTDAVFREGPFAGNEVPLVSPWTGNAGVSWNILGPQLWFDANVRYFSQRYAEGDEVNAAAAYVIPATTLVDVKLGGELDHFFWSAAVQNLFDKEYYDYANNQGFGYYAFYPQPGRTFMVKAGTTW